MMRSFCMKYLMVDLSQVGLSPVLFPATMRHADMEHNIGFPVRSAGWVSVNADGSFDTYGEATSMGLRPHEDDAAEIGSWLRDAS